MNTRPIVPARLQYTEDGVPYSEDHGDVYHPRAGAFVQAHHVFLGGNELPRRWQGRERFVVLETGFGLGNNFLATWQAWREDTGRCERLIFISIEQSPFSSDDMQRIHVSSPAPELARQLVDAWPALTHNLHTLDFEGGRVRLMLAFGDAEAWLPELVAQVDALYLDGFSPARNPRMWQPQLFKALARLAAPGATIATWTAASSVREGLLTAGFEVRNAAGTGGRRDMTLGHYAPRFTPRRAPSRHAAHGANRHAVIVGAGLAGCAAAGALAAEGWTSTVYDRCAGPAQQASGNPAGLFHGVVNAQDGVHARFFRAAALMTQQDVTPRVAQGLTGAVGGVLRLDASEASSLAAVVHRLGLPASYVQALDAARASDLAGLTLRQAAWYYPGGGWVSPADLAQVWLDEASPRASFRGGTPIERLCRTGTTWQLLDASGVVVDEAQTVILTNAADAIGLLGHPGWPVSVSRGQISHFASELAPGLRLPAMPVAGAGYVLPPVAGQVVFGATSQPDDLDGTLREEDHLANLAQLNALLGTDLRVPLQGRVGWRATARDRLPIVGAAPELTLSQASHARLDQPRFVPRAEGLFVCTGFASRGITCATLAARTLASWVTGAPAPLEASLLDAIDPARFASREARRSAGGRELKT
jgi:tRNA 5-methylaminomethyl-2-thiouridine biosynthesis bifunctional protein